MLVKKSKHEFVDYIFWVLLIIRSNPGGVLIALGVENNKSGLDVTDYLFVLLFGCFMIISHVDKVKDKTYKKVVTYLFYFGLYYFVVFGFFVPMLKETPNYSFIKFFIKGRRTIYSLLLVAMVYRF